MMSQLQFELFEGDFCNIFIDGNHLAYYLEDGKECINALKDDIETIETYIVFSKKGGKNLGNPYYLGYNGIGKGFINLCLQDDGTHSMQISTSNLDCFIDEISISELRRIKLFLEKFLYSKKKK